MSPGGRLGLVAAVGLLVGIATQIGQSVLPDGVSQAANSISPWLLAAFLLGSRMPDRRWAAARRLRCPGLRLGRLLRHDRAALRLRCLDRITGVLGPRRAGRGPGLRACRLVVAAFDVGWRRAGAIGLLAAVAIAEGIYLVGILPEAAVGLGFVAIGLLVPLVFGRTGGDRWRAYVAVLPALALGAVGYIGFLWLDTLRANL